MKEKLVVILGPTAAGKSRAGLLLADKLGAQIISGDSMLVYKGLDIGTAKPAQAEREKVKHHLIDILEPGELFSAAAFQARAAQMISEINRQGKIPVLVGGTGLYIKSLLENYEFSSVSGDADLRRELAEFAQKRGQLALWEKLESLDAGLAKEIHPNNRQRLIRTLEVLLSGKKVSRVKQDELVYDTVVFGLSIERRALYDRINARTEEMFRQGLVDEVRTLLRGGLSPEAQSMRGIGYKEVVEHLTGAVTLDTCRYLVARNTRRFAKRQFTWYKQMPYINWHEITENTDWNFLLNIMLAKLVETFELR